MVGGVVILGGLAVVTWEQYRDSQSGQTSLDALMTRFDGVDTELNQIDTDDENEEDLGLVQSASRTDGGSGNEYAAVSGDPPTEIRAEEDGQAGAS